MQLTWPFVGRNVQLEQIRGSLETGRGMVVVGEAGIGKSRLISEAVAGLTGFSVVRVFGSETSTLIPLSGFAHELPARPPDADGYANLLRWAADTLCAGRGGPLLIVVDDAHLLDQPSAALVHYLVRHADASVLATVRSREPAPDAVAALWKESLVPRLDLTPLDHRAMTEVAQAALGGPLHQAAGSRLWQACQGNALYLRELVLGALANGALHNIDGIWSWSGDLAMSPTLRDLVAARIGTVDARERQVLELVALGEPLEASLIAKLVSRAALERVERRGLIVAESVTRSPDLRMGHPLYGEVVRERCGRIRTREVWRVLAQAVEAAGSRRREDVLRIAVWRLDSDSPVQAGPLMDAAVVAWSSFDHSLAARLFQAALERGAGPAAASPLGFIMFHLGRSAEAVELLERVADELRSDEDHVDHLRGLAINLSCGLGEYEKALVAIDNVRSTIVESTAQQGVLTTKAVIEFFAGRTTAALSTLAEADQIGPMSRRVSIEAATIAAWTFAFRSDTRRSRAIIDQVLAEQETWRNLAGYVRPTILDAKSNGHIFAGELDAAEAAADDGLALAGIWGGWDMALAGFTAYRAQVARLRGDAASAVQRCHEAMARMRGWNTNMPRFYSELAHSAALLGDIDAAGKSLELARQGLGPGLANWALAVEVNAPWIAAARGDIDAAIEALMTAASTAQAHGLHGYQLFALHDVVRLGAAGRVAERLRSLASTSDGPLPPLCERHAAAAARDDGHELMAVSMDFAKLGMILYAAEAGAQAALAHCRTATHHLAHAAELRAWTLMQRCPGVRTPALLRLSAPDLTRREMQVARLAALGNSNRHIAEELAVSIRTVENHLATVYQKLGISGRAGLSELLDGGRFN